MPTAVCGGVYDAPSWTQVVREEFEYHFIVPTTELVTVRVRLPPEQIVLLATVGAGGASTTKILAVAVLAFAAFGLWVVG